MYLYVMLGVQSEQLSLFYFCPGGRTSFLLLYDYAVFQNKEAASFIQELEGSFFERHGFIWYKKIGKPEDTQNFLNVQSAMTVYMWLAASYDITAFRLYYKCRKRFRYHMTPPFCL